MRCHVSDLLDGMKKRKHGWYSHRMVCEYNNMSLGTNTHTHALTRTSKTLFLNELHISIPHFKKTTIHLSHKRHFQLLLEKNKNVNVFIKETKIICRNFKKSTIKPLFRVMINFSNHKNLCRWCIKN